MNARDTGINIKSAQMKTHMNVSTLLRQRNSNKCSCTKLQPAVQTVLNEKGKIEFHISIAADQEVFEELNERYKIMIS